MYTVEELLSFYDKVIGVRVPCYGEMLTVISEFVPDASNLLDVGIFSGNLEVLLCQQEKMNFSFTGIDAVNVYSFASRKMDLAGHRGQKGSGFIVDDLRTCHPDWWVFEWPNQFDVAISNLVIHSLKNKLTIFKWIHRQLKEGGLFLLGDKFLKSGRLAQICDAKSKEWGKKVRQDMNDEELAKYEAMWKLYPEDKEHLLSIEEHCSLLKKAGFDSVDIIYQYYQYGVLHAVK